jgi:hypothetical protein
VVISYSAFDTFPIPGANEDERSRLKEDRGYFRYIYCGLREPDDPEDEDDAFADANEGPYRLKLSTEIVSEFKSALKDIRDQNRSTEFRYIIRPLLNNASFKRTGLAQIYAEDGHRTLVDTFKKLSSGHKIVLKILAELTAYLDQRGPTLVLLDKPETHLHPPLLASLLRCTGVCR